MEGKRNVATDLSLLRGGNALPVAFQDCPLALLHHGGDPLAVGGGGGGVGEADLAVHADAGNVRLFQSVEEKTQKISRNLDEKYILLFNLINA